MWKRDVTVQTPSFGAVTGDIAYGGAFYFYVDGSAHGLAVRESDAQKLKAFGMEVKAAANAEYSVVHPELAEIAGVYGTIISGVPRQETSTQANCCVFADGEVDRSPTGSGTAGRVAQLHARGELPTGQELVNESIIGSTFRGKVLSAAHVGKFDAVIPQIVGSAFIYGFAQWIVDDRDALTYGFQVK
jgi:trans-L-3-hydroxyproline dehydratase